MSDSSHNQLNLPRLFGLIALLLVTAAASFFLLKTFVSRRNSSSETPVVSDSSSSTDSTEPEVKTSAEKIDTSSNSDNPDGKTPDQYDGENPNSADALSGAFTAARFSSDGTTLILRVVIDQYLSSGSCHLVISDEIGSALVEKSVEIVPEASTSTCAGFDVSTSELSHLSRPLLLTLSFSSDAKSGTLETTLE
ncbi:hypothetical protein IJI72_02010 [Candidatus Saccharibacteria bacterium]|nr:hypothetical protein [Candidatus Saccharibacteria bacterium]